MAHSLTSIGGAITLVIIWSISPRPSLGWIIYTQPLYSTGNKVFIHHRVPNSFLGCRVLFIDIRGRIFDWSPDTSLHHLVIKISPPQIWSQNGEKADRRKYCNFWILNNNVDILAERLQIWISSNVWCKDICRLFIGTVSDQKEKGRQRLERERRVACYGNSIISQLRPILQRSQFVLRQYLAGTFYFVLPRFKM